MSDHTSGRGWQISGFGNKLSTLTRIPHLNRSLVIPGLQLQVIDLGVGAIGEKGWVKPPD